MDVGRHRRDAQRGARRRLRRQHPHDRGRGKRLEADSAYALEAEFLNTHGLPRSFYEGGPHRWTEADRVHQLGYLVAAAKRCGRCGQDPDAWVDKDGRRLRSPPLALERRICWACVAKAEDVDEQAQAKAPHADAMVRSWVPWSEYLARREAAELDRRAEQERRRRATRD